MPGFSLRYVSILRKALRLVIVWALTPGSTNSSTTSALRSEAFCRPYSRWVAMEFPSLSISVAVFVCAAEETRRYRTAFFGAAVSGVWDFRVMTLAPLGVDWLS
ncbi:hypothetical protein CQ019_04080 [Arthrobacter sp. MYb229]|nr:hypothetical protein CQ019_04080 [Arthrobacter sp. MYb229]PRB53466.1 hypothetical protein CQ013_04080 [Arthrobacter sp. MYb216]